MCLLHGILLCIRDAHHKDFVAHATPWLCDIRTQFAKTVQNRSLVFKLALCKIIYTTIHYINICFTWHIWESWKVSWEQTETVHRNSLHRIPKCSRQNRFFFQCIYFVMTSPSSFPSYFNLTFLIWLGWFRFVISLNGNEKMQIAVAALFFWFNS